MTEANSDINRTYLYITTQLKSGYCKHSDTESRTHIMVNSMNSETHRAKVTSTPNKTGVGGGGGGVAGVVTEVVTSTHNQMEGGTAGVVTELKLHQHTTRRVVAVPRWSQS